VSGVSSQVSAEYLIPDTYLPDTYPILVLRSRDHERSSIARLFDSARAGYGGGLLLRGEPGIGKSALLADAREHADGIRVVRATCVEAESGLAYAVLQQLLQPVQDSVSALPDPQRQALSVALGLELGGAPDRFLISLAALTLLSELASQQPIVCVVDDAQWSDEPSLEVLRFMLRRLEAEPIAILASVRTGEGHELETAGMDVLDLGGLPRQQAATLLDARWGETLASPVRDAILAASGGNPLAVIELPRSLTVEQRAGIAPLPEPLPLAGQLEDIYLRTLDRLHPELRTATLVCAVAGRTTIATIDRATTSLGARTAVLELEGVEQVLRIDNQLVDFQHPLMRSAAYHRATPGARRAAHLALAEALADVPDQADRRAWHSAEAALGPDEEIAANLERSAENTLGRSGYAAAARALERSAELSPSQGERARRLVVAAEAAWRAGDPFRAQRLVQLAEQSALAEPSVRLRARYVLGSIELRSGIPADGLSILLDAVGDSGAIDPRLATRVLAVAGEASFQAGESAMRIGVLLAGLPQTTEPGQNLLTLGYRALDRTASQQDLARFREVLAAAEQLDDLDVLIRVAGLAFGVGEFSSARRLWNRVASRARALGAAGSLASALRPLALDETARGRYAWAEASAAEGRALAIETGQPNLACQYSALLAELAGIRGREKEAREGADEVLREASQRRLHGTVALMRRALGVLSLAVGRPEEAIVHLEALWALSSSSHRAIALGVIPDLVEAAVRAGRSELAELWLRRLLSFEEGAFPEAKALVMRSRALVASGGEADVGFQEALRAHAAADRPLDQARTMLLYGEHLRRERRRVDAREPLRAALEVFDGLGAAIWAERARSELRATGETARKRVPNSFEPLTRQELQVVRAVARGTTNREVASQLFISPRTVDHHLRSIFQKLGISSRAELVRIAASSQEIEIS
jgi:DNA-binding CsgD family transcriptional regulator